MVSRVTKDAVENLSQFENEKSCTLLKSLFLRLREKPSAETAAKRPARTPKDKEQIAAAKPGYEEAVKENQENKFVYLLDENNTEEKLKDAIQQISNTAERAAEIKADAKKYSEGAAHKITGIDARIKINGVEFTNATNSFAINGLTINAEAVTGDGDDNAISNGL